MMPRKHRHTPKRVFDRLVADHGFDGSYGGVQVREEMAGGEPGVFGRVSSASLGSGGDVGGFRRGCG